MQAGLQMQITTQNIITELSKQRNSIPLTDLKDSKEVMLIWSNMPWAGGALNLLLHCLTSTSNQ